MKGLAPLGMAASRGSPGLETVREFCFNNKEWPGSNIELNLRSPSSPGEGEVLLSCWLLRIRSGFMRFGWASEVPLHCDVSAREDAPHQLKGL